MSFSFTGAGSGACFTAACPSAPDFAGSCGGSAAGSGSTFAAAGFLAGAGLAGLGLRACTGGAFAASASVASTVGAAGARPSTSSTVNSPNPKYFIITRTLARVSAVETRSWGICANPSAPLRRSAVEHAPTSVSSSRSTPSGPVATRFTWNS